MSQTSEGFAVDDTSRFVTLSELQLHNTMNDCWVVIHKEVYDLTEFLNNHPGGANVILEHAGGEATQAFSIIHSIDILSTLPAKCHIGKAPEIPIVVCIQLIQHKTHESKETTNQKAINPAVPPIASMLNVFDLEEVAKQQMTPSGWGYYSSGADDEITMRENHNAFHRIFLRPRVLVNVANIDTSTTLLGKASSFPLFICATALGKLAHPDGELNLTRAAGKYGIIQMIPTLSSFSLDEIVNTKTENQTLWYQLYVNENRETTANLVKRAQDLGCSALCVTVDAPGLGKREKDRRQKFESDLPSAVKENKSVPPRIQGAAATLSTFIDPSLCWNDISWLQSISSMPIIIKGIQCGEDALLAVRYGVRAIIVSNHGGRQIDMARSSVEVLQEVMEMLRAHGAEERIEVFVDGGIRRGTDIFKCLALGARAVGIGRPTLYGMAGYGQEGVEKVLEIFKEEFETTMRMMGAPSLAHIRREMIITRNLQDHISPIPTDNLSKNVYENMKLAAKL